MVDFGLDIGTSHSNLELMADEPMEAMEKEYAFSELSSAFGPTEFADALSHSLNTHGTAIQRVLGSHGLVNRYQRLAQEK
jgi:hypothetical protein